MAYTRESLTHHDITSTLRYDAKLGKFYRNNSGTVGLSEDDGSVKLTPCNLRFTISVKSCHHDILFLAWFYIHGVKPPADKIVMPINGNYKDIRPDNLLLDSRMGKRIIQLTVGNFVSYFDLDISFSSLDYREELEELGVEYIDSYMWYFDDFGRPANTGHHVITVRTKDRKATKAIIRSLDKKYKFKSEEYHPEDLKVVRSIFPKKYPQEPT